MTTAYLSDGFLYARNLEKYATTLTAEGEIDDGIRGEARIIVAFEIMRQQLGMNTSHYPRLRVNSRAAPNKRRDDGSSVRKLHNTIDADVKPVQIVPLTQLFPLLPGESTESSKD